MDMAEESTKITIRMGAEDVQRMEDFMADSGIGNRSDFVREAIVHYIASKEAGADGTGSDEGIFVRLSDMQLGILRGIEKDGTCSISVEEFARRCILDVIVPKEVRDEVILRAVKAAQMVSQFK